MINLISAFLTSFVISVFATPLTIKLAKKFKLMDDPRKRPHPAHVQKRVVPRAGGLPIFLSLFISILVFIPLDKHVWGILIAILLLLAVGLLDDFLKNFSPYPRFFLQILAALVVVIFGVGITFITNPLGGILNFSAIDIPFFLFGEHHFLPIADLFALIWIVWMMNMINWAKGVDGQMPGIVSVAAITIGFLSFKLFLQGDPNQLSIAVLSFIVAGSSVGFLIFNWYPAKIFPGFSGSTILGFMIAVLSILSGAKLATALLVMLIPSIDFFYTFFRRLFTGNSPFFADSKHLHHLLLKSGLSHSRISLLYITSCAILGLLSTQLSSQGKLFVVLGGGVLILGSILWLHFLYKRDEESE